MVVAFNTVPPAGAFCPPALVILVQKARLRCVRSGAPCRSSPSRPPSDRLVGREDGERGHIGEVSGVPCTYDAAAVLTSTC